MRFSKYLNKEEEARRFYVNMSEDLVRTVQFLSNMLNTTSHIDFRPCENNSKNNWFDDNERSWYDPYLPENDISSTLPETLPSFLEYNDITPSPCSNVDDDYVFAFFANLPPTECKEINGMVDIFDSWGRS